MNSIEELSIQSNGVDDSAVEVGDIVRILRKDLTTVQPKISPDYAMILVESESDVTQWSYRVMIPGAISLEYLGQSTTINAECAPAHLGEVVLSGDVNETLIVSGAEDVRVTGTVRIHQPVWLSACARVTVEAESQIIVDGGELIIVGSENAPFIIAPSEGVQWRGVAARVNDNADSLNRLILSRVSLQGIDGHAVGSDVAALSIEQIDSNNVGSQDWVRQSRSVVDEVSIENCSGVGIAIEGFYVRGNPHWRNNRIEGCESYPIVTDAQSVSAVPRGSFSSNGGGTSGRNTRLVDSIRVAGGIVNTYGQVWPDAGAPYHIMGSIEWIDTQFPLTTPSLANLNFFIGGYSTKMIAGAELFFEPNTGMFIGAEDIADTLEQGIFTSAFDSTRARFTRFSILGTRIAPVKMSSALAEPSAGDWIGLRYRDGSRLIEEHWFGARRPEVVSWANGLLIEYAGAEYQGTQSCLFVAQPIRFDNNITSFLSGSTIRHCAGNGVHLRATVERHRLENIFDQEVRDFVVPNCACDSEGTNLFVEAHSGYPDYSFGYFGDIDECDIAMCTQSCVNTCDNEQGGWPWD